MSRLEILKASLEKKEAKLNEKFDSHFADVRSANGQPLNDKRNGYAMLKRWEKQNSGIRNQIDSIERTKRAIEWQEDKDLGRNATYNKMPGYLKDLIDAGTLKQWGKFPHIMFVDGVKKARIYFDEKTGICSHKFLSSIPTKEQYAIFRDVYNSINKSQKKD